MQKPTFAKSLSGRPRSTILIVDDDEAVRQGLRSVLVSEGYLVVAASQGREAVEAFRHRRCDLALVDMNMPVRNGWGTISDLRSANPQLPAIIITARPDQRNIAREAGVELMEKPLDLPLLLQRIDVLLSKPPAGAPERPAASFPA